MKKGNALKTILIILVIILISLVSFVGIFAKKGYKFEKVLPDYIYSMDFSDRMFISLKIKEDETTDTTEQTEETAEPVEGEEQQIAQTPNVAENVKNAKKVLEKRFEKLEIPEYYIRANEQTGNIEIELPKDMNTSSLQNAIVKGEFKVVDKDGNVLADSNSVKDIKIEYTDTTYYGTLIKLEIIFKEDALNKFAEIKNNYTAPVDENGNVTATEISMKIDDTSIYSAETTEFCDSVVGGELQLYMGQGTETAEELQQYYTDATCMAAIIKSGSLPVTYAIDYSNLISSDLNIKAVAITGIIIFILMAAFIIYKFKTNGAYATLSIIGFIASLLIVLRYTNVIIAFEGVFAIALVIAINYAWIYKYLLNLSKGKENSIKIFNKTIIDFADVFIISSIIAVAFCFASWLSIFSFGMIMFWGVILILAYNFLITRNLITNIKK